jgi:alpha-tubulin suppressor-like RCC1 family protein
MKMRRTIGLVLGACAALVLPCWQANIASAEPGGAYSWGSNAFGQLGNGTKSPSYAPTPMSLTDATSLVGREDGGAALLLDGTVMAWGSNVSGELGNGTTEPSATPTPVTGLSEVVAISAKARHTLALLSNGTVMAWGSNVKGQLGDGTTESKDVPVAVSGLEHVVAIAAGEYHSLALLSNGEVMAWGDNSRGELGTGGTESSSVPVPVPGLHEVRAIAAGTQHSLAVLGEGAVWAWGENSSGQLGTGTRIDSHVPVAVPGLSSGFSAVAAGFEYSLALKESGGIMSWGSNEFGELGDGTHGKEAAKTSPVSVKGITEATAISAGRFQSMALVKNGTAMDWGGNEHGELGIGSSVNRGAGDVPVVVCGLHEVGGVAAGQLANYAFNVGSAQPCPFVTGFAPTKGSERGGDVVTITGQDLAAATAVTFGNVNSPKFTVESATSITAVSPPGIGSVQIEVVTPTGHTGELSSPEFQYERVPVVMKVLPVKGPASGGTTVTISGEHFSDATGVQFGSTPAASFEFSKGVIKAITPADPAGIYDVKVTNQWGTSSNNKHDLYKVVPVVSSVTPSSGAQTGGTSVTVIGAGFLPGKTATAFRFGTTRAKSVNCTSTTECAVISPAHPAGTVDVLATANKTTSSKTPPADQFTYE